jgi:hypothetical protein
LSDNDRVVFSFLEAGVKLQSWNFYDPFAIQFDHAFIRPSDFVVVQMRHLQAPHLDLVLVLSSNQVLKRFEVDSDRKFVVHNVGDILLDNHLFDFVQRINEPHSAVVAFYALFCFSSFEGLIEAIVVKIPIAN